jgi:hemoglobin-like flavoprotein
MQHVGWGARPEHYRLVRHALVTAIRKSSPQWDDTLAQHWRSAITAIIVPMLQSAAVHTVIAERLSEAE